MGDEQTSSMRRPLERTMMPSFAVFLVLLLLVKLVKLNLLAKLGRLLSAGGVFGTGMVVTSIMSLKEIRLLTFLLFAECA
jgi:hypothetical protein